MGSLLLLGWRGLPVPKLPIEITGHPNSWLLESLWNRPHNKTANAMLNAVVCGKPNKGKSWLSLSFGWALDRGFDGASRFSIDRVCFSAAEFSHCLAEPHPIGTCIVFDDAGLNLFSRESQTRIVVKITKQLQQVRYKNLIILLNLPKYEWLDKLARGIADVYIEPTSINKSTRVTKFKFQEIVFVPRGKQEPWFYYPVAYENRPVHGFANYNLSTSFKIRHFCMPAPPRELSDAYEEKKKRLLDQWNKQTAKEIAFEEAPAKQSRRSRFEEVLEIVKESPEKYRGFVGRDKRFLVEKVLAVGCGIDIAKAVVSEMKRYYVDVREGVM